MQIIVTGAGGFIGRRLLARLAANGHRILAVDCLPGHAAQDGADFIQDDLTTPEKMIPALFQKDGFTLIHLAWNMNRQPGVYRAQVEQVALLAGLLDAWLGQGLQRAIMMGSAEEYGCRSGVIAEHDEPVQPLSPYGWAKRMACEMALRRFADAGASLLWMRPFIVYGPGQKGSMAIPYAIGKVLAHERAEFSDGLQQRDFIHVDDVVNALVMGVEKNIKGCHVLNLGTGRPVFLRDVLGRIAHELDAGNLFSMGSRPRRSGEPDLQVANIDAARKILGWEPLIVWQDGITATCAHE